MPESDLPKCAACGKEIQPLPESKGDHVVNVGGNISPIDLGVLYMGQICESCQRIICSGCWVIGITPENLDVCSQCGGHLVPLTSQNLLKGGFNNLAQRMRS